MNTQPDPLLIRLTEMGAVAPHGGGTFLPLSHHLRR